MSFVKETTYHNNDVKTMQMKLPRRIHNIDQRK